MALDPSPPVVTPVVSPAAPDGANGWYRARRLSPGRCPIRSPRSSTPRAARRRRPAEARSPSAAPRSAPAERRPSVHDQARLDSSCGARDHRHPGEALCLDGLPRQRMSRAARRDTLSGVAAARSRPTWPAWVARADCHSDERGRSTSASTLTYSVTKPAAIAALKIAKKALTLAKLLGRAGGRRPRWREVDARRPRPSPRASPSLGHRHLTIPPVEEVKAKAGTVRLKVKLTPKAKVRLRRVARAAVTVTLAAPRRASTVS